MAGPGLEWPGLALPGRVSLGRQYASQASLTSHMASHNNYSYIL